MKRFISIITAMVMVMALFSMPYASAEDTTYGIYNVAEITAAKERIADTSDTATAAAYAQFQTAVTWALTETPSAVAELKIPGAYIDSTGHNTERKRITYDAYAAYVLALSYQLTDNTAHADAAAAFLNNWATTNTSIPHDDTTGSLGYFDNPLVAAYGGVGLIYAAELITDYSGWVAADQTAFKTWVTNVYEPAVYQAQSLGFNNNWDSWGLLASIASNYYVGNTTKVEKLKTNLKSQINIQINNLGQLPSEIERGANGMWYTYFSLAPLTQAIQYVYNITGGTDNYFYYTGVNGGSVTKALNHLLPYITDTASWETDYDVTLSLKPVLSSTGRWPLHLYEAMRYIYGEWDENADGAGYADLTSTYSPIVGGASSYSSSSIDIHHIVWSFPSLMTPPQIITSSVADNTDYPEYLTDDFEGYGATGSLDDSIKWRTDLTATDGTVSAVVAADPTDATNHALKLTDTSNGNYVEVTGTTQPQFGLSSASFKLMLAGTLSKSSNCGVHISGLNASSEYKVVASVMYVNGSGFILRTGGSSSGITMVDDVILADDQISTNTWYDFKFVLNSDMETFDFYVNDTLVKNDHAFRFSASTSTDYNVYNVCRIKFATDSTQSNTINYIDDVFIGQLDHIEDDAENYTSDNWAPYIAASTGLVESGVCADPADASNQVIYISDTSNADYIEHRTDMRPKEGLCYVNIDIRLSGTAPTFSGFHLQDYTTGTASNIASVMYYNSSGKGLFLNGVNSTGVRTSGGACPLVPYGTVATDTWYNLKFVIDTYSQKFDVYVDNELKVADVDFRVDTATKFSRVKLTTDNTNTKDAIVYYDNIFAGDLNYKVIDAEVTSGGLKAKVLHDEMHADIYTAAYDADGRLLAVAPLNTVGENLTKLTDVEGTLTTTGTISTYKVFIFEDNGINPLCSSLEKTAN